MAKSARRKYEDLDFDPLGAADDMLDDTLDDAFDVRDYCRSQWGDDYLATQERFSARRKIERRNDMKKLYSQLDEFEEFVERAGY